MECLQSVVKIIFFRYSTSSVVLLPSVYRSDIIFIFSCTCWYNWIHLSVNIYLSLQQHMLTGKIQISTSLTHQVSLLTLYTLTSVCKFPIIVHVLYSIHFLRRFPELVAALLQRILAWSERINFWTVITYKCTCSYDVEVLS